MATLPQSEINFEEAHINDNLSTGVIAVCNVFTALALLSLIARLVARRWVKAPLGLDDYLAIAAMVKPLRSDNLAAFIADHHEQDTTGRSGHLSEP